MRSQIRQGISWLWSHAYLRTSALIFAGDNFVFQAIFLTFIVVAHRDGLGGGMIGILIAAFGLAALLGSLVAPRVAKLLSIRTIMLLNQWLNGLFVLYLAFPSPYVLVACVLPVAFVGPWLNPVIIGCRTAVTPDHLVGRVSSVARNIAMPAQPLGPLFAGLLLDAYGADATVLVDSQLAEPRGARPAGYACSFSRRRRLTTFGSAVPCVSRITAPTKKPRTPSLPPR